MVMFAPAIYIASKIVRDRPFSSYSSSHGGWNWKLYLKCLSIPFAIYYDVTILKQLFEKVIIPYEAYEEFSQVIILKTHVDELHYEGFLEINDFDVESESYDLFLKLCNGEFTGRKIGDGEAAAITLAVENNGILASNNTKDVNDAVKHFNLTRIKTGDILVKAF